MGLSGRIAPQIRNLSFLVYLNMSFNYFYGDLPQEMAQLQRLRFLDLGDNNITGSIPSWIGNLQKLRFFNMYGNSIKGALPDSLFHISTLQHLTLGNNSISGTLPSNMCDNLPMLTELNLFLNYLEGPIPSSIGRCSSLQHLTLASNYFTGDIPREIGNLTALTDVYFSSNLLTGCFSLVKSLAVKMNLWRDPGSPADSFYEVRPECTDVPKSKFRIKSGKTLSVRKWKAAFSPEGHLNIAKTLRRIHRGGIHPTIRGEVWEFLLGCYDPNSTFEERNELRQRRRDQYSVLKEECRLMFPVIGSGRFITAPIITESGDPIEDPLVLQEAKAAKEAAYGHRDSGDLFVSIKETDKKVIEWKRTLHQIGLDVKRTDRTLVFYEKQENLAKLWDILSVYAWFDKDVGYCQGMSDLSSPMIMVLDDEADSFWCFEHMMRKLRGNFRCTDTSVGVESQLENLASVTQVIDPKLHQHLEHLGGGNYLFAVRMLMVCFRREFSFCDSLYLWEMMWALEYDPELFLLYEDPEAAVEKSEGSKVKPKSMRQFGKFEREYVRSGTDTPLPISVFLVASVLKDRSAKLLTEARGLDDVVKILNDITGNLDAKKACTGALKVHKKYLRKSVQAKKAP